jgi:hypothetical protein
MYIALELVLISDQEDSALLSMEEAMGKGASNSIFNELHVLLNGVIELHAGLVCCITGSKLFSRRWRDQACEVGLARSRTSRLADHINGLQIRPNLARSPDK